MSTDNQTLAGAIEFEEALEITDEDPDDYLRIMFFSNNLYDSVQSTTWYSTKKCKDVYVDDTSEIGYNNWICPDVANITLHNNPVQYRTGNGQSFNLVVKTCKEA